jgi:hypothetical protein
LIFVHINSFGVKWRNVITSLFQTHFEISHGPTLRRCG